MKILFIILIFSLILLPLSKLRLKPEQKRIMRLREHAINHGLQVQFAATPAIVQALEERQSIRYQVLLKPAEQKKLANLNTMQWLRANNKVAQHKAQESAAKQQLWTLKTAKNHLQQPLLLDVLESALNTFPESINAVEIADGHIGCYWFEEGEIQDVAQIGLALSHLKDLLIENSQQLKLV